MILHFLNRVIRKAKEIVISVKRQTLIKYTGLVCIIRGKEYILLRLNSYSILIGADNVLRLLGATIDSQTTIPNDIRIQNAKNASCENLKIGKHVYVGPRCLFDLACEITIRDQVALSAGVTIVTHADVCDRPLKVLYPRKQGDVQVGVGVWIGVNSTILHGVTIGDNSVIGAMSLVRKNVPSNSLWVGIPARHITKICDSFDRESD